MPQIINHWALIYCALTGESLFDGGRDALRLFSVRRPGGMHRCPAAGDVAVAVCVCVCRSSSTKELSPFSTLQSRGWSLIINDDLVGVALAITNLGVRVVGCWVGRGARSAGLGRANRSAARP
jgi:hypothetical protein